MNTKKFLIVHPSRQRPEQAERVVRHYYDKSSGKNQLIYHMSVDSSDPTLEVYQNSLQPLVDKFVVNDNNNLVQATNRLYDQDLLMQVDIVLIVSDDTFSPMLWDEKLVSIFEEHGYDKCVKTFNQFINDFGLLVLPIAGSKFFIDYGCFYYPEYPNLFCDNDLTEWAKLTNRYVKVDLLFPHMHYYTGGACPAFVTKEYGEPLVFDSTYERHNSNQSFDDGNNIFKRRKKEGFPVWQRTF